MNKLPIKSKCLLLSLNQAEVDLLVKSLALVKSFEAGNPYDIAERRLAASMLNALKMEASYG